MSVNRIVLFCLLGLLLNGCQSDQQSGSWVPILEPTSFSFLEDSVSHGLKKIAQVEEDIAAGKPEDASKNLLEAQRTLLQLKHYFLPMTQIRQLVYDAGRLNGLDRRDEALDHLAEADRLLGEIGTHGKISFQNALQQPRVMIEKLRETLEQERQTTSTGYLMELSRSAADQFSALGHKINMMAIKGDLILSGIEFNQTTQDSR
jgi:hypothetical protein